MNLTQTTSTFTSTHLVRSLQKISLCLCFAVFAFHVLSLTLVITFDGQWYVRLSDILGTNKFSAEWDFLRTPLFPALLKFFFWLLGRQAMAVIGLQAGLACAGIYFLIAALARLGRPIEGAIAAVLLSSYPTLIAYEHLLLTEVGTFFFLSLFIYLLRRGDRHSVLRATGLAIAIAVGYYYRSSLLYLAPLLAAIYALPSLGERSRESGGAVRRRHLQTAIGGFIIVAAGPFLLAYPWQRNPAVSVRIGQSVLLYGLVKSSVLPPDDPILGSAAPIYRRALEESAPDGRIPDSGLQNGSEYSVIGPIYPYGSSAKSIFIRVIWTHPWRYFKGVVRNLLLFSEFGGFANDSAHLREAALSPNSEIDKGPSWFPPLGDEFRRISAASLISHALRIASPFYDWLILFGFVTTVIAFVVAVWRMDAAVLAFTAVPLGFIVLHAMLLMSEDRVVMPSYPLLLANLIMLPVWLKPRDFSLRDLVLRKWRTLALRRAGQNCSRADVDPCENSFLADRRPS